jgi:hypothetical protein
MPWDEVGTLGATVRLTAGLIVAMSWAAPAGAAPGDLDGSFSGDGGVRPQEVRTETYRAAPRQSIRLLGV